MPTASMVATRVAKFTDARTPGTLLSLVSTRLAQEEMVLVTAPGARPPGGETRPGGETLPGPGPRS